MKAVSYDAAESYCMNNGSVLASTYDDFDFAYIAQTCFKNQSNMGPSNMTHFDSNFMIHYGTESREFWTSIKVLSRLLKISSRYFLQFISDEEIIDEYGESWDPNEHPVMDAEILEPSYGVTIDIDGIARVQRLGQISRLIF